jgi:hypothetical protein
MEDDLSYFQLEHNINIPVNGRQPHFFQMEDNLNIFVIGRQPLKIT